MSKNKKKGNDMFLPGMEAFDGNAMMDVENDPSLEAELFELLGGKQEAPKPKSRQKLINPTALNLNMDDDIGDEEFDENDPELLAELNSVLDTNASPAKTPKQSPTKPPNFDEKKEQLNKLKSNYEAAINNAKVNNEINVVKRYERSLKTINELITKVNKGIVIDDSEIPPQVVVKPIKTSIQVTQSIPQSKSNTILDALISRQNEYKHAAFSAKNSNDLERAKGLMIVYKQFNEVISNVKGGETFDLSDMPPPPDQFDLSQLEGLIDDEPATGATTSQPQPQQPQSTQLSFEDELKSRLEFFQNNLEKSKSEGNASKIKRNTRLIQQYQEAIMAYKKKTVGYDYSELIPPPGKDKLTSPGTTTITTTAVRQNNTTTNISKTQVIQQNPTIVMLKDKQLQFKKAALEAKNSGDKELAIELLQRSKGIDPMLKAAENGLPVDLSQIPALPTELDPQFELATSSPQDFVQMSEEDKQLCITDKEAMFKKLMQMLIDQIKKCEKYRDEMRRAGDIMASKRFDDMASNSKKDLDGLKCLFTKKNAELPQFHYEFKLFSLIQANPDLSETEMEVQIIRATDLSVPSGFTADQLDTYVIIELPFPNETHQTATGEWIKKTNSPEYNMTKKFEINMKSRVFQRVIKNKALKIDIFYRKGLFSKDKCLGSVNCKLLELMDNCTLIQLCDIYDGRKLIGGKLEIKIRIRRPIADFVTGPGASGGGAKKQIKEKWLIIDDFNKDVTKVEMLERVEQSTNIHRNENYGSVDVLRFEIGELQKNIVKATNSPNSSATLIANLKKILSDKEQQLSAQEKWSNSVDQADKIAYGKYLNKLPAQYMEEAKKQLANGNRDKAQTFMTKKTLVEKEILKRQH